jgi:hypothetical protein
MAIDALASAGRLAVAGLRTCFEVWRQLRFTLDSCSMGKKIMRFAGPAAI